MCLDGESKRWSFCRGGKRIGLVCQDSINSGGYSVHTISGIYSHYLLFVVTLTELQVGCIIHFIAHSYIRAMHLEMEIMSCHHSIHSHASCLLACSLIDACSYYLHASCTACSLVRMMLVRTINTCMPHVLLTCSFIWCLFVLPACLMHCLLACLYCAGLYYQYLHASCACMLVHIMLVRTINTCMPLLAHHVFVWCWFVLLIPALFWTFKEIHSPYNMNECF